MDRRKSKKKIKLPNQKISHSIGLKLSPSICSNICKKSKCVYPKQYYVVPTKDRFILLIFVRKDNKNLIFMDGKEEITVGSRSIYELDLSNLDRYTKDKKGVISIGSIVMISGTIYLALSIATTEVDNIYLYKLLRQDGALVQLYVDNREVSVLKNKSALKLKSNKMMEKNILYNKCRRGTPKPLGSLTTQKYKKGDKVNIIKTESQPKQRKRRSRKERFLKSIIKPRYSHEQKPNRKHIKINESKNVYFNLQN